MATLLFGKSGTVTWASDAVANSRVTGWVLEVSVELIDTTNTTDSSAGYRTYSTGHKDWTATVDCLETAPLSNTTGAAEASLTLNDGTTAIALAKAIQTSLTYTADANDVFKTTYTFICSGAI